MKMEFGICVMAFAQGRPSDQIFEYLQERDRELGFEREMEIEYRRSRIDKRMSDWKLGLKR
jgi:hypothetical protein